MPLKFMQSKKIAPFRVSSAFSVFRASIAVGAAITAGGSTLAGDLPIPTFTDETSTRLSAASPEGDADISEKDYGLGDFDLDGDVDIIAARRIALNINTGLPLPNTLFMNESGVLTNRTAALAPALLPTTRSRDVAVADLNGDGWLDAIVVHGPNTLPTLLVNRGERDGSWLGFQERADLLPAGFTVDAWNVSVGDITGDGFDDAFIGVRTGTDRILVNLGNTPPGGPTSGGWLGFADESSRLGANANTTAVRSSVIVDINGDGDMDLIEGQTCCDGIVRLIPNDGAGNLNSTPQNILTGQAYNFALGDLDGDGNLDILGVRNALDRIRVNTGPLGDGVNWGSLIDLPGSNGYGSIVRVADLNTDGTDDFLVCDLDQEFPEDCTRRLNIYFNTGAEPYLIEGYPTQMAWTPNGTSDVAMIDLDDDGDLDMLIGWCEGQSVFMQDGSPDPEFCDLDGDSIIGPSDLAVLLGNWGPVPPSDPIADLNDDGTVGPADLAILLGNWGPCK